MIAPILLERQNSIYLYTRQIVGIEKVMLMQYHYRAANEQSPVYLRIFVVYSSHVTKSLVTCNIPAFANRDPSTIVPGLCIASYACQYQE